MKKLILPSVILIVLYVFSSLALNIPESLPEGTVVPDEVRQIVAADKLDNTIIYSNFQYGWYFFRNILGFVVLGSILMLGISPKIRVKAQSWADRATAFENAPLVCGGLAAFAVLLILFLAATPEHPVSAGSLGLALAWGVVGMFVGKSARFALNAYSRAMEHDADRFGLELTHDGATAARAFVKLANENLSNPAPNAFIEFWLFNHPTLKDRIDFCWQYGPAEETKKMKKNAPIEETETIEKPGMEEPLTEKR